jgi:tetratricopeptide (TPR) repeat protein
MADCQFYGLSPGGHHLSNVLLHTAAVIVLFLVLRRMTGALWRSAFVAALFAIHPLRVESVAWVAERKDVLSGLFFMLTIGAYVRYARRSCSTARYGLVLLLFALGLMCKPMLVTLPVVLLLLDYWPLHRWPAEAGEGPALSLAGRKIPRRVVLEKVPLLALSAACCLATLSAQRGAIQSTAIISLPLRLANALVTCLVYLGQMVCPVGLAVPYPYPLDGLPSWKVVLAGMLLAGFSVFALDQRRNRPWMLVGWLWYLVILLPVLGVIQVGGQAHADRFTYLPQIGIYVALTWLSAEWGAKRNMGRAAMGSLMTAVLAALILCAWKQTAYWKNSETLWTRALECTASNYIAHNNFGNILMQKGQLDQAITHYRIALQIFPGYTEAQFNLGTALAKKGSLDEAIAQYRMGLQIFPGNPDARINLALALLQKGKVDEAIAQYQIALQINPGDAKAHFDLANILLQKGSLDEAIFHLEKSLQIKPDDANAQNNLGNAFLQKGRLDEAMAHYAHALQINPDYAQVHNNLGLVLLKRGSMDEAAAHFQKALQLDPGNPQVLNTVAWVLATCPQASLRNGDKAVQLAQRASDLAGGNNPAILRTLAAALAEAGRFSDARRTAQEAMDLARALGQQDLAGKLDLELRRYEAGLPLHQ